MRKTIVAGNWKMNKTPSEAKALIEELKPLVASETSDVVFCVPAIDIPAAIEAAAGSNIAIGAENMYFEESGAYTGEIAPNMLTDLGVKYVILGHSERREYFAETDETVNKKVLKAFEHGITPIVCCGETLAQREQGVTIDFVRQQIKIAFQGVSADQAKTAVIAYEPIWAIGTGIGKPSVALSEVGWTPENGLCMPQLTAKKYQLTFIAGVTMKVDDINFKFFHINKWDNGEFKGDAISTTSELVKISSDGNLGLEEGQKFERGGIYRFTVDVTKGNTKAVLTVEKVGKVDLPAPDIFFGNDKMEVTDTDIYKSDQAFTQGQMITVTGIDNLNEWWIDPDFFEKQSDGALKFLPINGDYRVTANAVLKYFSVMALKDGKPAKLQDDGTGAIWAIGKGIAKPSVTSSEVGWEPSKALCLAQVASKKYQLTLKAGETLKTSGDPEVISFKFFHQNDWGGEFGNYASSILVEQLKLADSGNLEMQDNKAFEEGAVYRFTIDVTNGNANADLKVEKIN